MALENLKILEEKVRGMLARHQQVCAEKADLLARLEAQERAYATLSSQVRQYEQERDELRERVGNLLARLTGLEL